MRLRGRVGEQVATHLAQAYPVALAVAWAECLLLAARHAAEVARSPDHTRLEFDGTRGYPGEGPERRPLRGRIRGLLLGVWVLIGAGAAGLRGRRAPRRQGLEPRQGRVCEFWAESGAEPDLLV